ncbi:hypothetical protein NKH77_51625 [Streptomyces sp. M19]
MLVLALLVLALLVRAAPGVVTLAWFLLANGITVVRKERGRPPPRHASFGRTFPHSRMYASSFLSA